MTRFTNQEQAMQYVIDMAYKGINSTAPNPCVACIIVQDGEIVGEAYHQQAGMDHAERLALAQAGELARGATAYVNLEPCCHQGRTPPCTDALINAGVSKVISAMQDPNLLVSGGGFEILRNAGIEVEFGVLEAQAKWLNRGFVSRMSHQKPWVVLKSAATLDGRTAAFDGQSKWITAEQARHEVQLLRASSSAVLTGIGTVLADDPSMNVRLDSAVRQPYRVVLDSQLRIPTHAKIIGNDDMLVVFTLSDDLDKIAQLTELGVEVIQQTAVQGQTQIAIADVLKELATWQCNRVLVEAGQGLSGAFLNGDLVDEMVLFYAGSVIGDQGHSMFAFDKPLNFSERKQYTIRDVKKIDTDFMVQAVKQQSVESL